MRWLLGVATLGFLAGAALAWWGEDPGLAGILGRVGIVLAAIWLAYPTVRDVDRRTVWLVGLGIVVTLFRPRSAIVVLPVIAWFARTGRSGRTRSDRSPRS